MGQQLVTDQGIFQVPDAYVNFSVAQSPSGLSTTGVIMIVGEANQGPDYTLETDITQNYFGPTQGAAVKGKYVSGRIVDAFNAMADAANDPRITGAPQLIYIVKTNPSVKAAGSFLRAGLPNYGVLADKSYGLNGNLIYANVSAAVSEVAPTTGNFAYIPGPNLGGSDGSTFAVRVNGGSKQTLTVSHQTAPNTLVGSITTGSATGLNGLNGILATGGQNQLVIQTALVTAAPTLAVAATGNSIVITLSAGAWSVTPAVGQTLIIPGTGTYSASSTSVISGAGSANLGAYVVTGVTSSTITATKLKDATTTGITAPVNVSATTLLHTTDVLCYAPVSIQEVTGTNRGLISTGLVGQNVSATVSGQVLKFTLATGQVWGALPQAGDYLFIPSTAPAAISADGGWYLVTAATSGTGAGASTITATNLNNTTPTAISSTALAATTDIQCLRPVIDGTGKTLEIEDGGGNLPVLSMLFTLTGGAVGWVSAPGTPVLLTSASEYEATLNDLRQLDGINETETAGGTIAMQLGYTGTTGTATITSTMLTTSVTGGLGANLSITLSQFKTLGDLANFINAQTGYVCTLGTVLLGQGPVQNVIAASNGSLTTYSVLDAGTYGIASDNGAQPGRIKEDGYAFFQAVSTGATLVQLGAGPLVQPVGLPEVQSTFYLSGGAKGASTNVNFTGAIDACQKIKGNFLVPVVAQDAASDIPLNYTDPGSTYTIDSINAYAKSHCLLMSQIKRARNRQSFISKRNTYTTVKNASANIANFRCAMAFQDFKGLDTSGNLTQFQAWYGSSLAAGMSAAAGYKGIVKKGINCSGVLQYDGSFDANDIDDVADALNSGLLIARPADGGGFEWVSDQTTYGADSNFVYNSIQAVYVADTVALTMKQRMGAAFVGIDLADVSASTALAYLQGIMADLKRLKYITASDDAPAGWKNATITISGNAMLVSINVKLNTLLYFIAINFLVTQVTQTASSAGA